MTIWRAQDFHTYVRRGRSMNNQRMTCPVCLKAHRLRVDGTLRTHGWINGAPGNCPGSLHPPAQPVERQRSTTVPAGSWRDWAACRDHDTEKFFATDPVPALRVCLECPVTDQCLDWAMRASVEEGVFGGYTAAERRALANRRARA